MKSEKVLLNKIEELELLIFINEKSLENIVDADEAKEIKIESACLKGKLELLKWVLK